METGLLLSGLSTLSVSSLLFLQIPLFDFGSAYVMNILFVGNSDNDKIDSVTTIVDVTEISYS